MSDASATADRPAAVATFDPRPATPVPAETPLHHQGDGNGPAHQAGEGVTLTEQPLCSHLLIRGQGEDPAFAAGIEETLGLALPQRLASTTAGARVLRWITPDEWLLTAPLDEGFELENRLRERLSGHIALVDNSGGQTLLHLAGPRALEVLQKSALYDFHPRAFPVGKVTTLVLAKHQATIRRMAEEDWELVVRRSYADYVWRWLVEAT